MKGKIYCISNNINNKLYIGKTLFTLQKRFEEHCKDSKKELKEKRPLYAAMRLYGIENFSIKLIEECELSELEERERHWINYYHTYTEGYNATLGGDGKILYDYDLFIEDYKKGMLVFEIAEKYGCDNHTVTKALHLAKINGRENSVNRRKIPVYQYDKLNNFIRSFDSATEAAKFLILQGSSGKISSIATNIGRVLKGERKTAEGYIWKKF